MEKFKIDGIYNDLEKFGDYAAKIKEALLDLVDKTNEHIEIYHEAITNTENEIKDNEVSIDKCKNEIAKMKEKIKEINLSNENIKSTYENIVAAYSKTSEGETKNLYSEIIETARLNCEDETEKNEREITRLNDDINAISNNITNFSNVVDELNANLDNQKVELVKYTKCLDYLKEVGKQGTRQIDNISNKKDIIKHNQRSYSFDEPKEEKPKEVIRKTPQRETPRPEKKEKNSFDDSLKQIYDLTGYNGKTKKSEEPITNNTNLENLFKENDKKSTENKFENKMNDWEQMLNSEVSEPATKNNNLNEVNDMLKPYGTTYEKLKSLTGNKITYRSGRSIPFEMTPEDVIKCISMISSKDLKSMKVVGPEITLLRKVKLMKEGNI